MRFLISAALLALVLTGCGDDDEAQNSAPEPSATSASTTVAAVTMLEACPAIESRMPSVMVQEVGQWSAFIARIEDLRGAADEETRNALDLLLPGAKAMESLRAGQDILPLDANMSLTDSVQAFADRCAAAGSSALQ